MNAIITYFRESIQELELVRWPTRQQAVRLSSIVLVFTIVSAIVFGFTDVLLGKLLALFLNTLL